MPVVHEIKTWRAPFQRSWDGCQDYTVRQADRPFQVGDTIILREWDEKDDSYLKRLIRAEVTGITGEYIDSTGTERRPVGLLEGFVVLGFVIKTREKYTFNSHAGWEWEEVRFSSRWDDRLTANARRWGFLLGIIIASLFWFASRWVHFGAQ